MKKYLKICLYFYCLIINNVYSQGFMKTQTDCKVWVIPLSPEVIALWDGTCEEGYASGLGNYVIVDKNEIIFLNYTGYMVKGKFDGYGIVETRNYKIPNDYTSNYFEGIFKNDEFINELTIPTNISQIINQRKSLVKKFVFDYFADLKKISSKEMQSKVGNTSAKNLFEECEKEKIANKDNNTKLSINNSTPNLANGEISCSHINLNNSNLTNVEGIDRSKLKIDPKNTIALIREEKKCNPIRYWEKFKLEINQKMKSGEIDAKKFDLMNAQADLNLNEYKLHPPTIPSDCTRKE